MFFRNRMGFLSKKIAKSLKGSRFSSSETIGKIGFESLERRNLLSADAVFGTGALTMKNIVSLLNSISAVVLLLLSANVYATDWNVAPDPSATLLETVKKEAAESDVYQPRCAYHLESYDVSFSQYLPYYRLKSKIAQATEAEIDECVREFDKLNTKEQAYVLTALFIYERIRRRPMVSDEEWETAKKIIIDGYTSEKEVEPGVEPVYAQLLRTVTSNYNISRTQFWRELKEFDWFPYRPLSCRLLYDFGHGRFQLSGFRVNEQRMFLLPPCEFPPDAPDGAVSESVWEQRVNVIKKCADSSEVAFPAFHPEETDAATDYTLRKSTKLYSKWLADLKICLQFIDVSVHLKISPEEFKRSMLEKPVFFPYDTTLPYSMEEFLRRTDKKERTGSIDSPGLAAIREYWIVWQSSKGILARNPSSLPPHGNSSVEPQTLGEIARFLLEGRIQYDRPFFDRELLKR